VQFCREKLTVDPFSECLVIFRTRRGRPNLTMFLARHESRRKCSGRPAGIATSMTKSELNIVLNSRG